MTLQGSLEHIQLPDVVQLVSTTGKSGRFRIRRDQLEGLIYLDKGQIVHAEVGDLVGEDAIYEMAIWNRGEFVFEPNVEPPRITIEKSNTNLFMEAARRIDEWRILSRKIPSIDMIPEMVPNLPTGRSHIQLNTGEWLVIAQIDGKKSIREIAKQCNLSAFDTAKILYGLITHNLVQLKPMPEAESSPEKTSAQAKTDEPDRQPVQPTPGTKTQPRNEKKVSSEELLLYLDKVREISLEILGQAGREIVEKQYEETREAIKNGKGIEVIQEAVTHIAKAATVLKGPSATELLLRQLKSIKV